MNFSGMTHLAQVAALVTDQGPQLVLILGRVFRGFCKL